MEIKKGIVKSVQANGDLKLQHGVFYKFEIQIGDDVGEYLSKSDGGGIKNFPIGQEKEYQLIENSYGKKIKPHFVQQGFSPKPSSVTNSNPDIQRMIVKQSSLKVASDLCIANNKTDLNSVFQMADKIVSWVMDDKAGEQINESSSQQNVNNDLPF